jgi:hypothetical protein
MLARGLLELLTHVHLPPVDEQASQVQLEHQHYRLSSGVESGRLWK